MMRVWLMALVLMVTGLSFGAEVRVDGKTLYVNESRIHSFVTANGGLQPAERARQAANVLKAYTGQETFQKALKGKAWVVLMGSKLVLSVTPQEAKALKISAQTLAATITQRLIDSLTLPALQLEKTTIVLPPDKSGTIKFTGYAAGSAKMVASNLGVVSVTRLPGQIVLKPLKAGETKIRIEAKDTFEELSVEVMPYALDPRAKYQAEVVGYPADQAVVAGAVAAALQAHASTPKGVSVWAKVLDAERLMPGQYKTITARVKAVGAGYYPFEGDVVVRTRNVGAGIEREDQLWYSNDPENITKPGQLYWAKLESGRSARLLFHHKNTSSMPLVVRYVVANPTDAPAKITVSVGEGRPDRNPTRAGYIAGDQFLTKWVSRSAEVLTVPPHTAIPLSIRQLGVEETCSGLASLSLGEEGAEGVVVIGESVLPVALYDEWQNALNVNGAWHASKPRALDAMRLRLEGTPQDVFAAPYLEQTMDYEAGGRFGFARIGEQPLVDESKQRTLLGNFGVVYDIRGTLKNPTPAPIEVEVLFEASAGYGSGLFYINGDYVKLGLINPKQEIVLASIKLPPGKTKPLRIQTMPLSGANYPVTLIVRPTGFELLGDSKR